MTLIYKYKIRLKQLNQGYKEFYDGEKEIVINIIKTQKEIDLIEKE